MRNIFLFTIACLSFAACKKSTSTPAKTPTPVTSTIPADGWILNGTTYKQTYCLKQESQHVLTAFDALTKPNHTFAVFFKNYPTTNGTYHIVAFVPDSTMKYPSEKIGDNDVIITGSVPGTGTSYKTYWSTGTEKKDATITITNGKIKVEVPEVAVTDFTDTYKITGTSIEN